jgi:hypothetical protein
VSLLEVCMFEYDASKLSRIAAAVRRGLESVVELKATPIVDALIGPDGKLIIHIITGRIKLRERDRYCTSGDTQGAIVQAVRAELLEIVEREAADELARIVAELFEARGAVLA